MGALFIVFAAAAKDRKLLMASSSNPMEPGQFLCLVVFAPSMGAGQQPVCLMPAVSGVFEKRRLLELGQTPEQPG